MCIFIVQSFLQSTPFLIWAPSLKHERLCGASSEYLFGFPQLLGQTLTIGIFKELCDNMSVLFQTILPISIGTKRFVCLFEVILQPREDVAQCATFGDSVICILEGASKCLGDGLS